MVFASRHASRWVLYVAAGVLACALSLPLPFATVALGDSPKPTIGDDSKVQQTNQRSENVTPTRGRPAPEADRSAKAEAENRDATKKTSEKPPPDQIRITDWIAVGSAVVSAAFAVMVGRYTKKLYEVGRDQHAAAIGAQRPWVKVTIKPTGFLVHEDVVQMQTEITVVNVGNTPATHVVVRAALWPINEAVDDNVDDGIKRVRAKVALQTSSQELGQTLFPGDPIMRVDFQSFWDRDLLAVGVEPARDGKTISVNFGGVVSYKFAGGTGETPFALRVWTREDGRGPWNATPRLEVASFGKTDIRLVDWSQGLAAT